MKSLSHFIESLQQRLFTTVVSNNLVYNTCWEDPRVDRQLLQLDSGSRVVMLTSAGDNALDYLLDDVQRIHCVDANPAQNALLEFKKTIFKRENFGFLWQLFGEGRKQGADLLYRKKLRSGLDSESRVFWDRHISDFIPSAYQPSFYFSGTAGRIAQFMHNRIKRKGLYPIVINLLNAHSLEEQRYYFEEVEPQLWNGFSKWMVRQHATMTMLGVPSTQRKMIEEHYKGGMLDYIRQSLRQVFTEKPITENYFWRVYLTGSYTRDCCPNYLKEKNFSDLSKRINRITLHTEKLISFLQQNPGPYTHFVLLDHQDWMADSQPELLEREWKLILQNAEPGTRILFRSAGKILSKLPDFVMSRVSFDREANSLMHEKDRVGTYESTYLGVVK